MEPLILSMVVIFVVIVLAPSLAKRVRVPVIIIELLAGVFIGVSFLNLIPENPTLDFLSSFGLTYLMFLAGLEIDFTEVTKHLGKTLTISLFSLAVPFGVGFSLGAAAGMPGILLGTIFAMTSLGLILPVVKDIEGHRDLFHVLLGTVVIVDIVSMFLLAFTLSYLNGAIDARFVYSSLAIVTLFVIPWVVNAKVRNSVVCWVQQKSHFEMEVRLTFALIFIFAALVEVLGFHSIIGAFIAGLIISELGASCKGEDFAKASALHEKLEGFGYGFFIPLFFIIVGSRVDVRTIFSGSAFIVPILLAIAVIAANLIGAGLPARLFGYSWRESVGFGFLHAGGLSLVLAAAEIARREALLTGELFSALVVFAILVSLISPTVAKALLKGPSARASS